MKETMLSNNERTFVEKAIVANLRIDKRQIDEFRNIGIFFGKCFGTAIVSLGDTRVFASVSCEVSSPRTSRPNEGTIFINVETGSPMSEQCIVITRILERTIRDSGCIDMESLCIIAEEKVWNLRIDITVLNNEGNITDCACIAAISALAHFRRPDCTTSGDGEFIIHKPSEKDLIPTVLHHYPICVTYALFDGKISIADPSILEERVTNASITFAINSYKELCSMHLTGVSLTSPFLIQSCSERAADRAKHTVEFIKDTLEQDRIDREKGVEIKGFSQSIKLTSIPSNYSAEQKIEVDVSMEEEEEEDEEESSNEEMERAQTFKKIDKNTVVSSWKNDDEVEEEEESSESDIEEVTSIPEKKSVAKSVEVMTIDDDEDDDDEEKETIILK